ncbi:MAG TPA: YfhO family protein [Candidatus Saccharimonadales bacterium]|nr:YfhO family protein [Candidatus Saccharimonadales bacterium]
METADRTPITAWLSHVRPIVASIYLAPRYGVEHQGLATCAALEKAPMQTIAELRHDLPTEITLFSVIRDDLHDTTRGPSFRCLVLVLCLAWLALNLPVHADRPVIPWDAMDEFYPMVYFNAHSLRLGLVPWWNPHIYSGYPQIADPQGMLFSPLLMAWMLLRETPGPIWFTWGVLLHVLMGGIAMLAFLRRHNANALGALMGAMVYMDGGVAASRLEHTPIILAYSYAPVVLVFLQRFLDLPTWRRGLLFGLAAGVLAVHLVQVAYLFILIFIAYGMFGTARRWTSYGKQDRQRWIAGMSLALVGALTLALPQSLFSWAFLSMSNRAVTPLSASASFSLNGRAFLSLLAPNALHTLQGRYDGSATKVETYLYIGAIPLLTLFALPRAWLNRSCRALLFFSVILASFACLYMLGTNTPFYRRLYAWLPGMQHFRRPSDAAFLLNFSLALMTGIAASQLNLHSRREIALLLTIIVCWLLATGLDMPVLDMHWPAAASMCALLALWRLQKSPSHWQATLWLLAVLIVDYRCSNLNGTFNRSRDSVHWFITQSVAQVVLSNVPKEEAVLPPRIEPQNTGLTWDSMQLAWDNMVILTGLFSTQGYNPLRYNLYDQWYGARDKGTQPRINTTFNPAPGSALSKLLGVRYLVFDHQHPRPAALQSTPGFKLIYATSREELWRTDQVYPRVLTPSHARLLATGEQPDPSQFARTDFYTALWLTPRNQDDARGASALAALCTGTAQATAVTATPTQLHIQVQTNEPAWVVLSELDFPGWKADIDGTPLAIHRANGMFRAVCVPAGEHDLHFRFHPWAMVAYAWQQARDSSAL